MSKYRFIEFAEAMKKTLASGLVIFLIALLVTGCGGAASQSSQEAPTPEAKSIKSDFVFMSDFLDSLKSKGIICTEYVQDKEVLLVKEQGNCNYMGQELTVDLFGDAKTTLEMVKSLKAFGGYWLTSNNWVIVVQDESVAKDLSLKLEVEVL
jgi:hypothetical protein